MKSRQIKRVIFIIADTLRAQNVGLYGANPSPTPNIDKLGQEGVVFTNAYTTITKTDPSITAIMSGLYPISSGLINHGRNLKPEESEKIIGIPLLAEILKQNGFFTAAIDWLGRWHKRGYSYYSGKLAKNHTSLNLALDNLPILFYLRVLDKIAIKFLKRDFLLRFYYSFFPNVIIPYDPADTVINEAIRILKKKVKNKIFLYLHLWDAHEPYTKSRGLKSYLLNNINDIYNDEVLFLDNALGKLFNYLKITKQMNDTLLIITSDHGETFSSRHRPLTHEGLYEDVVKIPLIFKYNLFPPKRIGSLTQSIDILSTILDLLNISSPKNIDGRSLLPLLLNKKRYVREFVYFEDIVLRRLSFAKNALRRRGLVVDNYKYLQTFEDDQKKTYRITLPENAKMVDEELYDLKKDPQERKNIAKDKLQVVKRLKKKLEDLIFELTIKRMQKDLLK